MVRTVCFVISAHGFGHASRQMEVIRTLLTRRTTLRAAILTAAPRSVYADYFDAAPALRDRIEVVPFRADVGMVQRDGLTIDHDATLDALAERFGDPRRAEEELAAALSEHHPAVVVADIPAVAFAAAHRLGVPSVGVGNFDWAYIYGCYAAERPGFASFERVFRGWQSLATVAVHLTPGPPLSGFRGVVAAAPVARRLLVDAREVRRRLGLPAGARAVLVSFGGHGLSEAARRIPELPGVAWVLAPPMEDIGRADVRFAPELPYLGLLAACDAVFTKPGYGIACESARHRTRLLYTDRGDFPEAPSLVAWMHEHAAAVHVPSSELDADTAAALRDGLARLFALPDRWYDRWEGAEQVADVVEGVM